MKLHSLAHGRTGDKGTSSNISVIAYRSEDWPLIEQQVTAARVAALFDDPHVNVTRYVLPQLHALNFVVHGALKGGVTRSLALDAHGKALAFAVLELDMLPFP